MSQQMIDLAKAMLDDTRSDDPHIDYDDAARLATMVLNHFSQADQTTKSFGHQGEMAPDRIKSLPLIVAVDFDGVIHRSSRGWHDGTIYDCPMEDAIAVMRSWKESPLRIQIIIHSVRATPREVNGVVSPGQYVEMEAWLKHYGIPYDAIHTGFGKPLAHLYIDDRAIAFENWNRTDFLVGSMHRKLAGHNERK